MTQGNGDFQRTEDLQIGLIDFDEAYPTNAPDKGVSATALLLDDFADALSAYTLMSARANGAPVAEPRFVRARDGASCLSPEEISSCDVAILAISTVTNLAGMMAHLDDMLRTDEKHAGSKSDLPPTAIGLIAVGRAPDGADMLDAIMSIAATCRGAGHPWVGGVIVTDGVMLPRLMKTPRLGAWRRNVSESIDYLVAAVRLGCSLDELEDIMDADKEENDAGRTAPSVIIASPHKLWRSAVSICRRPDE